MTFPSSPRPSPGSPRPGDARRVSFEVGGVRLEGLVLAPSEPRAMVIFVHGSQSDRHSPRNRELALALAHDGFATLRFDLYPERDHPRPDARTGVGDAALASARVIGAIDWVTASRSVRAPKLALMGSGSGAAAALQAAARRRESVGAIVTRGGRLDLASDASPDVQAPVLLIVGGRDATALEANRAAQRRIAGPTRLEVISGATHLFEEPGALAHVAEHAASFLRAYLSDDSGVRALGPRYDEHAIPRNRWATFAARYGRRHRGRTVTLARRTTVTGDATLWGSAVLTSIAVFDGTMVLEARSADPAAGAVRLRATIEALDSLTELERGGEPAGLRVRDAAGRTELRFAPPEERASIAETG